MCQDMCSVIYTVYFTYRGMVDDTKQIRKSCNLRHVFHHDMVDDTKQYESHVIYAGFLCRCVHMVDDMKVVWATR